MNRVPAVAVAVLAALVVGGCSSAAVEGQGSVVAARSPAVTSFPSSSPATSPSAGTPTPTSSPSTADPTASAKPGGRVCPSGSAPPFCYTLPAGFRDYSYLTTYGAGWTYKTLVSVGQHDLLEVLASREHTSYDSLSSRQLLRYFERTLQAKAGHYSVRRAGPVRTVRVDGARGFEQHAAYTDGVQADTFTVFRGRVVVSLGCQSRAQKARVATACRAVRRTIRIR